ncbi:MAG: type II secretion system F family protein [Candidatus Bathyarchaeota archaeon]|nr:MAG: type II secretion system F family protein [Candidatus Bathyarchaeota archaeon]
MSFDKIKKLISQAYRSIKHKISPRTSLLSKRLKTQPAKGIARTRWKPELFAYQLLGEKTSRFLPLFKDMDAGLYKSGLNVGLKPYVSLTLLTCLAATVFTLLFVPSILHLILQLPLFSSLLFGIGSSLLAGALTIIGFYVYPLYKAENIRRDLNDSMAFSAGYLAILAGAGVPFDSMFRSLSQIPQKLAVVDESKAIIRDVDLFGTDFITALENASNRTPSERFKELLEGFIATIHSGGNLRSYLLHRSKQNMRSKRVALRKFSDTLSVVSEFYVTLLVAGPLIFVVMLAVMATLGSGGFGILEPTLLLTLITYVGIPVGSLIFVIVLDALTPRW